MIISSLGYDLKGFVQFHLLPLLVFGFEFIIVFLEKNCLVRILPYFKIQVNLQIYRFLLSM